MRDFEIYPELEEEAPLILAGEYHIPLRTPPATVLDLGANCGLFSQWARQKWPEATITAYEPWPESVKMFERNFRGVPGVRLVPKGVRAQKGPSRLFAGKNRGMCSFHETKGRSIRVHSVQAASIPSHEFVKIDTEGSEWEILQGLDLSRTRAIALEAHTREDAPRIEDFLHERGFLLHSSRLNNVGCWFLKFVRRGHEPYPRRLMIAVPYYGGAPTAFFESLMRVQAAPPCHLTIKHLAGDSLVSRARNTLTGEFLRSDCSDLLFIDSDLIFSVDHIKRILSHDEPVVGGFYPKKQEGPIAWVCNAKAGSKPRKDGLQEVRFMGTGFLRIQRHVLDRMIRSFGRAIRYVPDSYPTRIEYDLWPVGPYQYPNGTRRYLSEDWYFCQRWLDLGGRVYGDTRIVLKHVGQAVYPLRSQIPELHAVG